MFVNPVSAIAPEAPTSPVEATLGCEALIVPTAQKYGLNAEMTRRLYKTLYNESWGFTATQSQVPDPTGPNGLEDSWGCAQIHLPSHKTITREQALDDYFAVDFAAKAFANGDMWMWTEYRKLYGTVDVVAVMVHKDDKIHYIKPNTQEEFTFESPLR